MTTVPAPSEHSPDCTLGPAGGPCDRCAGFQPGNALRLQHGCYSVITLAPRARQLRDDLEGLVPTRTDTIGVKFCITTQDALGRRPGGYHIPINGGSALRAASP